jgi:predicted RNA-binding protein with PUA-like domain
MNFFIFQSVPDRYDMRNNLQVGAQETWYATRYRQEMSPGDYVFFWMGGDEFFRGLYGWGILTSSPYVRPSWDSYGVDVRIEAKFKSPIRAKDIKADPMLERLLIFRAPQATNFLVAPDDAKRLIKLIKGRGEKAPEFNF